MSSSFMLERPDPTIKSSHLVDGSLRSQHTQKPSRLRRTPHIPQWKTPNLTAKRTVEILPIGYFSIGRWNFSFLTYHI